MPTTTASLNYNSVTDTTDIPITLASLATSSSLTVGRQSTIVTNVVNKYLDCQVQGQVMTHASSAPTLNGQISVYVFVPIKNTSSVLVYSAAGTTSLGEADAVATFDAEQRGGGLIWADSKSVNVTPARAYSFAFSILSIVGYMPLKWGLWVTQSTGQTLNATAGNHWFNYIGSKVDVA